MWQNLVVGPLSSALAFLAEVLASLGVPFAWGFAIIAFTLLIKLVTLPLSWQQVQSSKKMQELQPRLQALQKKYANNKEKLAQEQMKLYKEAGVKPLGGCLPSLVQLPIWIGLYQALLKLANAGALTGGFLWIQDLSFPNPQVGLSWLWPPGSAPAWPGWGEAVGYLVLPILTVLTQVVTQRMMTPSSEDQTQSAMNSAMMFMPFMFGFFALTFPSGLALYWVTSNLFTMAQQYFLLGKAGGNVPGEASAGAATAPASAQEPAEGAASQPDKKRVPRRTPAKRGRNARKRRRS